MKLKVNYISKSGKAALVQIETEYANGIAIGGRNRSGFVLIDPHAGIEVGSELEVVGVNPREVSVVESLTEDGTVLNWLQW